MRRVPGLKTLRRHGRRIAARVRPSALVLGYHRVTEDGRDPFGMAVTRATFALQMEHVARLGGVRPLDELVAPLAAGGGALGGVAITFDDGYVDNAEVAGPVLARLGLPFTVFVTTGRLGRRFWWHRLASIRSALAEKGLELVHDPAAGAWGPGPKDVARRDSTDPHDAIYDSFAAMSPGERDVLLTRFEPRAGEDACAGDAADRTMSEDELRRFASGPGVAIGAHGITHEPLTALDEDAAQTEIVGSRDALARITGRAVRHFSYPHGRTSRNVAALVRAARFEAAFASEPSPIFARTDPFRVPRVWVPRLAGEAFARWLGGWTGE